MVGVGLSEYEFFIFIFYFLVSVLKRVIAYRRKVFVIWDEGRGMGYQSMAVYQNIGYRLKVFEIYGTRGREGADKI